MEDNKLVLCLNEMQISKSKQADILKNEHIKRTLKTLLTHFPVNKMFFTFASKFPKNQANCKNTKNNNGKSAEQFELKDFSKMNLKRDFSSMTDFLYSVNDNFERIVIKAGFIMNSNLITHEKLINCLIDNLHLKIEDLVSLMETVDLSKNEIEKCVNEIIVDYLPKKDAIKQINQNSKFKYCNGKILNEILDARLAFLKSSNQNDASIQATKKIQDIQNKIYINNTDTSQNIESDPFEWIKEGVVSKLLHPSQNPLNTSEALSNHLKTTNGRVITRFPPEPNGYLHIGHAKALNLSYDYSKMNNGEFILRFDDTNPKNESFHYAEQILYDANWLLTGKEAQQAFSETETDEMLTKSTLTVSIDSQNNINGSDNTSKMSVVEINNLKNSNISGISDNFGEGIANNNEKGIQDGLFKNNELKNQNEDFCVASMKNRFNSNRGVFDKVTFASDHFEFFIKCAFQLIKDKKAFVCNQSQAEIKTSRLNNTESPFRNRTVSVNLALFQEMIDGLWPPGSISLRLLQDMKSTDPLMHDLPIFRVMNCSHFILGTKYCVYPLYDFVHCINDSLENITHSFCSREFYNRRTVYYFVLESLKLYKPIQFEFGRLNLEDALLSKRKILELINSKIIKNWDDPRLFTISGLRKRGVLNYSINKFVKSLGITFNQSVVELKNFESIVRNDLNLVAKRINCVVDPIVLNIYENGLLKQRILIEKTDYQEKRGKDFLRLTQGQPVGLLNNVTVELGQGLEKTTKSVQETQEKCKLDKNTNNVINLENEIQTSVVRNTIEAEQNLEREFKINDSKCVYLDKKALDVFVTDKKPKKYIHWVDYNNNCKIEIRNYSSLYKNGKLNENSLQIITGYCDPEIKEGKIGDKYQFRRLGFYRMDEDTKEDKIVMNLTIPLKSSH